MSNRSGNAQRFTQKFRTKEKERKNETWNTHGLELLEA